jgi:hypothetical protein
MERLFWVVTETSVFYEMCNVFYITLKIVLPSIFWCQKILDVFFPRNHFEVCTGAAEIVRGFQMWNVASREAKYYILCPFSLFSL